jgi:hypothetical protein
VGETVWRGDGRCDEGEGEKVGMEGIDSVHLLACFSVGCGAREFKLRLLGRL